MQRRLHWKYSGRQTLIPLRACLVHIHLRARLEPIILGPTLSLTLLWLFFSLPCFPWSCIVSGRLPHPAVVLLFRRGFTDLSEMLTKELNVHFTLWHERMQRTVTRCCWVVTKQIQFKEECVVPCYRLRYRLHYGFDLRCLVLLVSLDLLFKPGAP